MKRWTFKLALSTAILALPMLLANLPHIFSEKFVVVGSACSASVPEVSEALLRHARAEAMFRGDWIVSIQVRRSRAEAARAVLEQLQRKPTLGVRTLYDN